MSILSKLWDKVFLPEWSFKYNCYETAHTWTPHCSTASWEIGSSAFAEGLKMYSALNTLQFILNRKYTQDALLKAIGNILNSSTFLGVNGFLMFSLFCGIRRASGKFYYSLVAFLPSFIAAYVAIFIERPHRRSALALYLINIASECLYRVAIKRKLFKPIPKGEIMLFTTSMSVLMYLYRIRGLGNDPISLLIKGLIGREESKSGLIRAANTKVAVSAKSNGPNNKKPPLKSNQSFLLSLLSKSHPSCPHQTYSSCFTYFTHGLIKSSGLTWSILTLISSFKNPSRLMKDPSILLKAVRNGKNLRFAGFLGLFVATFRLVNCILRASCGGSADWHAALAGSLAGLTMALSPNSTIATYVTWKCIENLYCLHYSNGLLPDPVHIIPIIYATSVSIIFYCGVLSPDTVRPSYVKFMDSVTKQRIHQFNRNVLSIFRTGAEKGYEDYIPNLDPRHCSRAFLETNYLWMLPVN
ncbi:transmembrane protein 135 isoform X2 [Tetranychus urticae]|nr:transmembrane protein 135 isoform X2 [Tetranychus urticae]XP_015791707.1 transmembrane protein 135 isoform X2 [Tetranychus urticae]XP_025017867.1 transmembrane protein 135 isoform X2 [Tetranychus urticae]